MARLPLLLCLAAAFAAASESDPATRAYQALPQNDYPTAIAKAKEIAG